MKKELVTFFSPKDPESEMFRNLRTNIQFMNTDIQTLLVTSTMPGEGKSYVSSNLAITFAQAGKRVVLVDSDMRKGRLYNIFDIMPRPGLSNYLSGVVPADFEGDKDDIINYIQETEVRHLYVIAAGNVPPNPSELLVSPKMTKMINELKELCDIVIFDSTPSLIVADPVILARQVDSSIIVTSYNQTKMDKVEKVKNSIEQVGGKIAGIVMNKVPVSSKKYEDSYYYGNTNPATRTKREIKKKDESINFLKSERFTPKVDYGIEQNNDNSNIKVNENIGFVEENKGEQNSQINSAQNLDIDELPYSLRKEKEENNQQPENARYQNVNTQTKKRYHEDHDYTKNSQSHDIHKTEKRRSQSNRYALEDKTKTLLDQINQYLEDERKKLNED